ncbi:DUF596 domain-containing protein [Advenella mimigardefordensis]|uniref:DUF596 domain-containing protein n=1 Tax=Advenella mimigardefordensis TaxID=302406 RepID=UPI00046CEC7D
MIASLASLVCGLYAFPETQQPVKSSNPSNIFWKSSVEDFLVSDEILQQIWDAVQGRDASTLWIYVCSNAPRTSATSYQMCKSFFLFVVHRLMKEGRLKLAYRGKYCSGSIEEQVQDYSDRWPEDWDMLDRINFQFTVDSDGRFVDFWPKCGFIWVYKDGSEIWTYTAHKLQRCYWDADHEQSERVF